MIIQKIKSFDELKHGDKIISPIDNEVTEFYIYKDGEKYLSSKNSIFPYFQFDANDFYLYDGEKEVGEVDKEYFQANTTTASEKLKAALTEAMKIDLEALEEEAKNFPPHEFSAEFEAKMAELLTVKRKSDN